MGQSGDFRAGQRVRIRSGADSDFAGRNGVIMHVGKSVCDVRIRYKPRGSKVRTTYIGTFKKGDLESLRKPVDLAMFETTSGRRVWGNAWTWIAIGVVVVGLITVISVH